MSFLITYDEVVVEDYREFGGDIERTYLNKAERLSNIDATLARFKDLHKMCVEELTLRVL